MLAFLGSVTTGVNKCGTPLYIESSTFLGSTKTSFTSSGFERMSKEHIILLMQTDFPEPVDPATNRCGVLSISHHTGLPMILLPRAARSLLFSFSFGTASNISLMATGVTTLLGSSTPTVFLPGIGAWIRTSLAPSSRAISLFNAVIFIHIMRRKEEELWRRCRK